MRVDGPEPAGVFSMSAVWGFSRIENKRSERDVIGAMIVFASEERARHLGAPAALGVSYFREQR